MYSKQLDGANFSYYTNYYSWYDSSKYKLAYQFLFHPVRESQYWKIMMIHKICFLSARDMQVNLLTLYSTLWMRSVESA